MATITITGNLTSNPELRFANNGQAVAGFSVAENRRWQDRDTQEWNESVSYFDIVAWGPLGEHTAQSVAKGDRVTVTGRIAQRSWETPEGDRRTKFEITATDVAASLRYATVQIIKAERSEYAADSDE